MARVPGRPTPRRQPGAALSLIELLVVLAIIVVLGALLWPPHGCREKARQAQCQDNLKHLALGLIMYAQDHGERFPRADAWSEAILPYVKDPRLFVCPGDDSHRWRHGGGPYAMSAGLSGADVGRVAETSMQPMLWDAHVDGSFALRHGGRGEIAFVDGHVKVYGYPFRGMEQGTAGVLSASH